MCISYLFSMLSADSVCFCWQWAFSAVYAIKKVVSLQSVPSRVSFPEVFILAKSTLHLNCNIFTCVFHVTNANMPITSV